MTDWLDAPDAHLDPVVAAAYDRSTAKEFRPETITATVEVLAELAGDGAALEFAVGTGRIALPLAERGVTVHGLDFSEPMLDQLRAKPNAELVELTVGDMTSTTAGEGFALVYLIDPDQPMGRLGPLAFHCGQSQPRVSLDAGPVGRPAWDQPRLVEKQSPISAVSNGDDW